MEFQLNPNAAEFIPGSPPKHQLKLNAINDSLVAGSPLKSVAMDDIKIPSQKEFNAEIAVRPREMEEETDSPNGDHMSHSDYDFFTEGQKVQKCLDESEISSTKAEYGDESTMSSLFTADLHKTGISTMEDSFGESECDIYNRDNPMTMSYTPCDFKAAFKKEVDLNAVHDLSDGDLEDENCSFEVQSSNILPSASTEMEHRMESSAFSNGESSDQVQSFSGSLQDETTFLKFGDSEEPKTTEFMQMEFERHQSSPIDQAYGQDIPKQQEESPLAEDSEEVENVKEAHDNEQMETHKEAKYVEDEKDIAENDIVTSNTEHVEKPVEIAATDLIQPEIPQETSFQDHNFLSSTIHEVQKSVSSVESTPKSVSPIGMEHVETSSKPLDTDMISSMENLVLEKEPEEAPGLDSNQFKAVSETPQQIFNPYASSWYPFHPTFTADAKPSFSEGSMDPIVEPSQSEQHAESSFIPTLASESVSGERPNESLLDFSDTATEMPIKDHIEETKVEEAKVEESFLPTFEESVEKPLQDIDESVCLRDTNKQTEAEKQTYDETVEALENLVEKTEGMNIIEVEKVNETPTLNLSESIQEFTGLEKQLEPENVSPEESSITELPTIETKTTEETVVDHKEPIINEVVDEKMILDTKEEEILKAEELVNVGETTQSADTVEVPASLSTTDFVGPIVNIETETPSNIIELATAADTTEIGTLVDTAEIAMPVDTTETASSVDTAEIAMPVDSVETAAPVTTAEIATLADIAKAATAVNIVEAETLTYITESTNLVDSTTPTKTVEIEETANTVKKVEISESAPLVQAADEQKATKSMEVVESKVEEAVEPTVLAAGVVAAAATATAAGIISTTATSMSKAKAKPGAKTTKPGTSTKATPKSTPTSPSKSVSSTTRPTTTKRVPATMAARPKLLDTAGTRTSTAFTSSAKATATAKTVSSSKPATSTTKTAAPRPPSAATKTKPAPTSARSTTTSSVEKKSVLNGDVKSLSKGTTTKPASKPTATSSITSPASARISATKTTTTLRATASATATATATKSRPTSATAAARSPAKSAGTISASVPPNAAKTKTSPASNSATKLRTSLAKSPMMDKQIKETANKQISMARSTTSTVSKTTRTSTSSTAVSSVSATATKRLSSTKSMTTTSHSPVKKVVSKVTSGNSSGTKTSATTKVKVVQNGTADNAEITKTTIITNIKNEDDVPKKDLSPLVAPTDNQLIVSAD